MRGLGSIIGLLVVALISVMAYKYFLTSGQSVGAATPVATIDAVGAQNDLIAIAQAERAYQAQNGKYASLDELLSDGSISLRKPNREGYTYDVDASDQSFVATARCTSSASAGCHNYSVDPTMSVHIAP
ncbi:MAG TPA: hypothetical protein VHX36_01980 [Candidatus Acidoferrales bacterium]|jgi:hypothetical protein|nr:hypothetical protein [Candidatus Acidoferrales bacterium]